MIFWILTTPLHGLSICFPLFRFVKIILNRMASLLCFSLSTGDMRAGSIPKQLCSLMPLVSRTHIQLYVQQIQSETSLSAFLIFMIFKRFQFTQIFQVWVNYIKSSKLNSRWNGEFYLGEWVKINTNWITFMHTYFFVILFELKRIKAW